MVILDTDIIIDHLRQPTTSKRDRDTFLMKLSKRVARENLAISTISIQELYEGQSTKEREKEEYLLATIGPLKILTYNYEIAQLAGEIARDLKNPIELADAAIAATAIFYNTSLLTKNKKHFKDIPNLELFPFEELE